MDKYKYKYETHLHTMYGSACSNQDPEEYVRRYKELGYDGIFVTDHFFHGNTKADRGLKWEDYIEAYCMSYEKTKEIGDREGLKVFFGFEETNSGDEYLIYGLDKKWLLSHEEIRDCRNMKNYYETVKASGGVMIQAHPFRQRGYIKSVNVHPFQCDAMEVCNWGNKPEHDALAYNFCKQNGIVMTSGTDIHSVNVLDKAVFGMCFEKPIETISDYVNAIKNNAGFVPIIPEDRKIIPEDIKVEIPVFMFNENDEGHEVTLEDIFIKR